VGEWGFHGRDFTAKDRLAYPDVPLASAGREIALGAQGVPGGSPAVVPTVDSSLRYANVYKAAVAPVIWSQLGRVERSPGVTMALSSLFVGGLARVRSWQQRGRPHPVAVGAVALELVAPPALALWQRRVRARSIPSINGELS
jgi:hypothetical protein